MFNWIEILHPLQIACYMMLLTVFVTAGISIFLNYATTVEEKEKQTKQEKIKNNLLPNWSLDVAMRVNRETCCDGMGGFTSAEKETYQNMLKKNSTDTGISIFEPSDCDIITIAQNADFIVNGYAFTSKNNQIRVLNLNNRDKATVLDQNGNVVMTSMDDIEISIVQKYFDKNKEFLKEVR